MRLVPKDNKFFEMFGALANNMTDGCRLLVEVLKSMKDVEAAVERLSTIEHTADRNTHNILVKLHQTFITPLDREDIHRLASSLDDVLDFVHATGERLVMYHITSVPKSAVELAEIILKQAEAISGALASLENHEIVLERCVEINRLENEADRISRSAIAALFVNGVDPITLIKLKELYETLETATDKAEDVANVLESIVLKNA